MAVIGQGCLKPAGLGPGPNSKRLQLYLPSGVFKHPIKYHRSLFTGICRAGQYWCEKQGQTDSTDIFHFPPPVVSPGIVKRRFLLQILKKSVLLSEMPTFPMYVLSYVTLAHNGRSKPAIEE